MSEIVGTRLTFVELPGSEGSVPDVAGGDLQPERRLGAGHGVRIPRLWGIVRALGGRSKRGGLTVVPCLLAVACWMGVASTADVVWAQTTADDGAQAATRFERGVEYEQAGAWSEALELLRQAGRLEPTPQTQLHIAWCEENLGNPVAALGGYRMALAQADRAGEDFRRQVEQRIAALEATIPKLTVVRGEGADTATIELDGNVLGATRIGTELPIEPGPHTVTARAPGRENFTETFRIGDTGTTTLRVRMKPVPAAPALAPAPAGEVSSVDHRPPDEPDRPGAYIVGVVGGASLLATLGFVVARSHARDEAERLCGGSFASCRPASSADADEANGYLESADTYATIATVTAAVGVGALGVSVAMLLFEPLRTSQTAVALAPSAPGAPAGMSLYGRF